MAHPGVSSEITILPVHESTARGQRAVVDVGRYIVAVADLGGGSHAATSTALSVIDEAATAYETLGRCGAARVRRAHPGPAAGDHLRPPGSPYRPAAGVRAGGSRDSRNRLDTKASTTPDKGVQPYPA
jgi:hypothetical protein